MVDSQVQGDDGVAALCRSELLGVVTRGIIRDAIPSVAITSLFCEFGLDGVADGQVQGDDGVATLHRGELLRVVTRGVVGLSVPSVAFADLLRELGLDNVADGEVQSLDAFAASSCRCLVSIGA